MNMIAANIVHAAQMGSATGFVVYDTEDSSSYQDGMTEAEARVLCDEKNSTSRRGHRYAVASAAEFAIIRTPVVID